MLCMFAPHYMCVGNTGGEVGGAGELFLEYVCECEWGGGGGRVVDRVFTFCVSLSHVCTERRLLLYHSPSLCDAVRTNEASRGASGMDL